MELLPDLLESVARLRVKVGGTFKGARREVDFTSSDSSVTITGTDDSVNERMTLDLVAASGAGAGPTVVLSADVLHAAVSATATNWEVTWNDAVDPLTGTIISGPTGIGLTYALDNATAAITATEDGAWIVTAACLLDHFVGSGQAAGDYIYVEIDSTPSFIVPDNLVTYPGTHWPPTGGDYLPVSTTGVVYLASGESLTVRVKYYTSDNGSPLVYGTISVTRII